METNHTDVTQPTALERADALRSAREVLTVKAGKFAERELEVYSLVALADWILEGDTNVTLENLLVQDLEDLDKVAEPFVPQFNWYGDAHPSQPGFFAKVAEAARRARREADDNAGVL